MITYYFIKLLSSFLNIYYLNNFTLNFLFHVHYYIIYSNTYVIILNKAEVCCTDIINDISQDATEMRIMQHSIIMYANK